MTVKNTLVIIGPERERALRFMLDTVSSTIREHKGKLVLSFDSIVPLTSVAKQMILVFPYLKFVYYYECDEFRGTVKGGNGKVVSETYKEGGKAF
jgi:hypothetical protein